MRSEEQPKRKARDRRKVTPGLAQLAQNVASVAPTELVPEPAWHERATFQVAFDEMTVAAGQSVARTRAYHEEADGRAEWPGVAGEALIAWMRERTELPAPAAVVESPRGLHIVLGPLEVVEIPVEQGLDGAAYPMRLQAQLAFQITGPTYLLIANQSNCSMQILACDMASGELIVLAAHPLVLQPDQMNYTATTGCDLPEIGHYQLVGMVTLPNHAAVGVTLGPLLTVTA
jgi:hypothetical protein